VLQAGADIRGRIVKDGKPVPGISVGLVQVDRGIENFVGQMETGTNETGEFEFRHMPPGEDYYLYTHMKGSENRGTLQIHQLHAGRDRSIVEAGDLTLEPAYRLAGRVISTDGKSIPKGVRLMLTRELAWDHQNVPLDAEGRFTFDGVPEEGVTFILRVPGYRLAAKGNRLQRDINGGLAVYVDKNRDDIEIYVEPDPSAPKPKGTPAT
jgi:hypothetical protein